MSEVKAQRVVTYEQLEAEHRPGQFWLCGSFESIDSPTTDPHDLVVLDKTAYTAIWYVCPCGCGDLNYLPFRKGINADRSPSWKFDENPDCPTLSPSILRMGGCRYHGHLNAGVWKSC